MRDSMIRPVLCASAAAFRGGKLLIARRTKPPFLWSLPGGAVEWGETLAAAALRELKRKPESRPRCWAMPAIPK